MRTIAHVAWILTAILVCAPAFAADAVIIANNGVKANDASVDELRDVFLGTKTSLKDGSHVVPVTLKGGPAHEAFLKEIVGKSDTAFRAGWRSLVFTGQANLPKTVDSDEAMVSFVASNPGAIGYISAGAKHENVKVISVK